MQIPPGSASLLKPGSDVHPVAVNGAVLPARSRRQVDADAELHAPVLGQLGIALGKLVLDLDGAVHRFDSTGNSPERCRRRCRSIARVGFDARAEEGLASLSERRVGPRRRHEPRIAGGVGGKDGGQACGGGHRGNSPESGVRTGVAQGERKKASK